MPNESGKYTLDEAQDEASRVQDLVSEGKAGSYQEAEQVVAEQDKEGNPTVPREAIRMQGDHIEEVRGIADEQNLDVHSYEFDMRLLTYIDHKVKANTPLDKDDLKFLYEIDNEIAKEGFGPRRDPRVKELRDQRNPIADASIIFECHPSQIAQTITEISTDTKAYIGPLEPGIFDIIQKYNIEHIYGSFPEGGKMERIKSTIGGRSKNELINKLKKKRVIVSNILNKILSSPDFSVQENPEEIDLIKLTVRNLGFPGIPTTEQIYARASELGLDLCPAETALSLLLEDNNQTRSNWYAGTVLSLLLKNNNQTMSNWQYVVATKPIADRNGHLCVFRLSRDEGVLWLGETGAGPTGQWDPREQIVFRLRKVSPES